MCTCKSATGIAEALETFDRRRDYLALNAPDVPGWFEKEAVVEDKEPIKPACLIQNPKGNVEQFNAEENAAIKAYNAEFHAWTWKRQTMIEVQWRYYWADLMIKESKDSVAA